MAKIIWKKKAEILLADHITYARQEFGVTTAQRWMNWVNKIEARLRRYPESYTDTVHIVDIWDMRMNPEKLKKRIK